MTKRDEAVFAKAFEKMKAKGYFDELQAKGKAKSSGKTGPATRITPVISKIGKKPHQKAAASVFSSRNVADKIPLVASKK